MLLSHQVLSGTKMTNNYEQDGALQYLAQSLVGRRIVAARLLEHEHIEAIVELTLDDESVVNIGVSGSLHDEAYLVFDREKK